jgi:hypothetical protein
MPLTHPVSSADLRPSERQFIAATRGLGFGRFESLPIRNGELVLDPWPVAIRDVKFGSDAPAQTHLDDFVLKRQVAEFFEYVRSVDSGEIRRLEIRHGLVFSMEVQYRFDPIGARRG